MLSTVTELQTMLYGLLIIVFLVMEPRGLYGLWVRIRGYFKPWPSLLLTATVATPE